MSKALSDMYSRKSGNAGEGCGNVGTSENIDFNTSVIALVVFSVSVAVPELNSLTQHAVWDLIQSLGLFLACHTCNMHTSILSSCPRAFDFSTDIMGQIKTSNSQNVTNVLHSCNGVL